MNEADIMNPWIGAGFPWGARPAAAVTESGPGDASGVQRGNTYLSSCFSWIIHFFGGDNSRITIMGNSAGAIITGSWIY